MMSNTERLKAIHEAAHAVFVLLVGWRMHWLAIGDGNGGDCQPAAGFPPEPRTKDIARRELLVCCAGFAAERIEQGLGVPTGDWSEWWGAASAGDCALARAIVRDDLRTDRLADRRRVVQSYARLAFALLLRPDVWAMVNELAGELERERRLEENQIEVVWRLHDPAPATAFLAAWLDSLAGDGPSS
jgi:hypothetical protein